MRLSWETDLDRLDSMKSYASSLFFLHLFEKIYKELFKKF